MKKRPREKEKKKLIRNTWAIHVKRKNIELKLKCDWIDRRWKWSKVRERNETINPQIEWTVTDSMEHYAINVENIFKCTRFWLSWRLMPRTQNQRDLRPNSDAFVKQCVRFFVCVSALSSYSSQTNWVVVIKWSEN